jgi:hypothetical protein
MEIYRNGKTRITLTQRDFAGQGGEGAVYIQQGIAYKVYSDPNQAIPVAKIGELAAITDPAIIKPEEVLTDANGQSIGYTMRAVENGVPLCQTFSRAFRDRNRLTPDKVFSLVQELQARIASVHHAGVLVVDVNEMNFLVARDFSTVFAIDVASYQTASFPATAIMESVRDRHATTFSEGTDWFSFAILACQLFIGIHPYRGKHPKLGTLDERMRANVSLFNPQVQLPPVCQPLTVIPPDYRAWLEEVLENGKRLPPPSDSVSPPAFPMVRFSTILPASGALEMRFLGAFDGTILDMIEDVILTSEAVYCQGRKLGVYPVAQEVHLMVTTRGTVLLAWQDMGKLHLWNAKTNAKIPVVAQVDSLATTDGRLYGRSGSNLVEFLGVEAGEKVFVQPRIVGSVLEYATQLFPGVAVQDLLGACYVSLLPESGVCQQVRLPELDNYRLLNAEFQRGVLLVVAEKAGQFDRFVFRFASDYRTYDTYKEESISDYDINVTVLPNGIALQIVGGISSDTLRLFEAGKGRGQYRTITDPVLTSDSRLFHRGTQACLARTNELYEIRMRVALTFPH